MVTMVTCVVELNASKCVVELGERARKDQATLLTEAKLILCTAQEHLEVWVVQV